MFEESMNRGSEGLVRGRLRFLGSSVLGFLMLAAQQSIAVDEGAPQVDERKITATGIRKLAGDHIVIYTDLPAARDIDELPKIFDAAIPLWCEYFGVNRTAADDWKVVGSVMKDKERFAGVGLYPDNLPPFPHGYCRGSQLWVYDQPSGYYRRHLLLHEGTHLFMQRFLGGSGPPWYSEGMAELLGTHRWQDGKLALAIIPRSKDEVPYWGRIKVIKDDHAAGRELSLLQVMQYDARAHLHVEAYAWSWAATAFLDQHPITQRAFRDLKTQMRTPGLSERFRESIKDHWNEINEEWQLFVSDCDYGYDVARAAVERKPAVELPAAGEQVTIAVDRGWQSSGLRLERGKTYHLTAQGRYQIAGQPKPWPCEAGGVTIRYQAGQPLGKLLAAVSDLEGAPLTKTPLVSPQPIGLAGDVTPAATGTLYLKINEAASGLGDNGGSLQVTVRAAN
jgi:hypothetical protein